MFTCIPPGTFFHAGVHAVVAKSYILVGIQATYTQSCTYHMRIIYIQSRNFGAENIVVGSHILSIHT